MADRTIPSRTPADIHTPDHHMEVNYYQAEYGDPPTTAYHKQQYRRFRDWQCPAGR